MGKRELEQYRAALAREQSSPHRYTPSDEDARAQSALRHEQNLEYIATHSGITHVNPVPRSPRAAFINRLAGKRIVE